MRIIIKALVLSLFLSVMQSCYVEQDTGRHRWWYHRHDLERNHHDHDRGDVIIIDPDRHDRDDHDH